MLVLEEGGVLAATNEQENIMLIFYSQCWGEMGNKDIHILK